MRKQNRGIRLLHDETGASFVFVLAVMVLLMIIGVSVLTAAGANARVALSQKEYSEVMLLDDSVHKSILYALQRDTVGAESREALLSAQLAKAIYAAHADGISPGLGDMPLSMKITVNHAEVNLNNRNITVENITLSFPTQNVMITPPIPAVTLVYHDEAGVEITELQPREPQTATVNAIMVVTVTIRIASSQTVVTTRALYEYTGGVLSDDPDPENQQYAAVETPGAVFNMEFVPGQYGRWELIKRESIDA